MDPARQRHLEISCVQSDEHERGLLAQVSVDGELLDGPLTLLEPFSLSEQADLRWYLEQYASQEPFDSDKAHKAAASIVTYGKELHRQLRLHRIFQKQDPLVDEDHSLTIDVCESYTENHGPSVSLQSLHWELLEQLELWSGYFNKVIVRRISPEPIKGGNGTALTPSTPTAGTLNVLVVIARNTEINPTAYQDVRPFAALDVLLGVRDILRQQPAAPRLRVDVVRPGTFDALKQHLKSSKDVHGSGFYHFVHFDMHGRVAKRRLANGNSVESAWLDFASPGPVSRPKPVPAESVAKLLADHGINCAILNACESARADQGLRANLAATFLEKGVGNVLAMFCKFPSSVIEPFFSVFYEALLCEGLPMSTAAAEARKHLREHGLRKSRFGLELQVQDWFIPVSYHLLRHNVLLGTNLQADSLATCRPVERTTPRANPLITGREFDLLRLEEAVTDAQFVLIHGHAGVGKSGFVQYAFDRWRDTQYFDKLSMVDLPKYLRKPEIGGDKIMADGSSTRASMADSLQTWTKAVVVLDGVDWIFNNVFSREFRPIVEAVSSLLRQLTGSEFVGSTGKRVTFILTSRLGKEWWEARFPQPLVTPEYFELAGLELPAAVTFAQSLLQSRGFPQDKRGSQETHFLVHIVNLLQRNPLAIKVALPTSAGASPPSLKDVFNTIHVGEVCLDYGSVVHTPACALIAVLESVYQRFPEYQDTLCGLADFWIEGPLDLQRYIRHLAAYCGLSQVYDMSPLIKALNEVGAWCVSKQNKVEWLHPVFTLYLRQRRRTHAYRGPPLWAKGIMKVADFLGSNKREHSFGSTASLQMEIPRRFVSAVGHRGEVEFMTDIVMGFMSDCNLPQSMQRTRGSFFNLLTVLDMLCGDQAVIPLEVWPLGFVGQFLSASRLALSAPELEMLTGYVQATLDVFQERVGGFAVHPHFQIFFFNLIVHLFVSSLVGGTRTGTWGPIEQLVTQALAMVEASEATYGPMADDKLMWKAMVYRCQAFFLLIQKDEAGADAAWDHMKSIELDCFGPSAFQPSTFDPPSLDPAEQSATFNSIPDLFGGGPDSKLQKPVASWVPVRHAAWPLIKEQVLRQGNTQALNELHIPGIENAFENMVSSYREAGVTGLENWERYHPPRNDLEGYIRRAENPEELLAQLEDGLGRGDWKLAAQAHQLLAKKAAAETKMDVAVFHLEQLVQILGEADPDSLMAKRATMARDVTQLVLAAKQRGFVKDEECLQMVEMMEEAGLDIKTVYRAQGLPEEFAQAILDVAERAIKDRERLRRLVESAMLASRRESNDPSS